MQNGSLLKKKKKFVNDKLFGTYTKPEMIDRATDMLTHDKLSEEGFLGAQAVLLLNGLL